MGGGVVSGPVGNPRLISDGCNVAESGAPRPRLLRMALHLGRDPGDAEDLVQATFLTAIEKAATYDASRPLLPWLTGILIRHAQMDSNLSGC